MLQTISTEECQLFLWFYCLCAVYLMIHASYLGKDIRVGACTAVCYPSDGVPSYRYLQCSWAFW